MDDVIDVKVIDILSGDDVDLFVPVGVQCQQLGELIFLLFRKIREVMEYD